MRSLCLAAALALNGCVIATPAPVRAVAPEAPGMLASPPFGAAGKGRATVEGEGDGREIRALSSAVILAALSGHLRVRLIDPDLAPDPEPLRGLDAFVVREADGTLRPVIYINRKSDIVRRAAAGSALHVGILAAVLHHEAQHLAGASEEEARRAELTFFNRLIARGEVPADEGRQYLQLLNRLARAPVPVPTDR